MTQTPDLHAAAAGLLALEAPDAVPPPAWKQVAGAGVGIQ